MFVLNKVQKILLGIASITMLADALINVMDDPSGGHGLVPFIVSVVFGVAALSTQQIE